MTDLRERAERLHQAFHTAWPGPAEPLNLYVDSPVWLAQAEAVEKDIAAARSEAWAGADEDPGDGACVPTPGQLLRRLADADPEQRLIWAQHAIENSEKAHRCWLDQHTAHISSLKRQARETALDVRDIADALEKWNCDESLVLATLTRRLRELHDKLAREDRP